MYVGVPLYEDVTLLEFWRVVLAIYVSVGEIRKTPAKLYDRIVRHDWKVQNHLVYLCIAVATHAQYSVRFFAMCASCAGCDIRAVCIVCAARAVCKGVEHCNDLLGVVVPWKLVARPMVEDVT